MKRPRLTERLSPVAIRIVLCAAVLALGLAGLRMLKAMKKPPAVRAVAERSYTVEAARVAPSDYPVAVTGYGEAKPLNTVAIAPEVGGRVVGVHARLEAGEVIPAGDVLFEVDARDYTVARDEAEADVAAKRAMVERLVSQEAIDRRRLDTLERNQELAEAEFTRRQTLFDDNRVGTQSGVEAAERVLMAATDQAALLARAVELYPVQLREARSALRASEARLARAALNVSRCTITAPFEARVKAVTLEAGQIVSPGQSVLTLADDSTLEIHVPLDSRDARRWLQFDDTDVNDGVAWFNRLAPVACDVRWTEDPHETAWHGTLHRVVNFDSQTRTLIVAVRIDADEARASGAVVLPLVEGMFCSVAIPGRTMHGVFRLPRWAVSFENSVYVSVDGRLKTVPVEVARIQGEDAFVEQGLDDGDLVIVTRLVNPLEGSLLDIRVTGEDG